MRDLASNIILPSIDNFFSSEEERQDAKLEKNSDPAAVGAAPL